ncbi:uncharacterized protein LOC124431854, partial [Vespa crabro]|uniref:uncharacterized protein LOC124431854 n=1 Tax=Vespa crabro TaxID=7445 RepID=UPI001EFF671D
YIVCYSFLKKVTEIVQYMCLAEILSCMLSICVVFYALNRFKSIVRKFYFNSYENHVHFELFNIVLNLNRMNNKYIGIYYSFHNRHNSLINLQDYTYSVISLIGYSTIIISFTYNLFIFCYIGELLDTQVFF